MCGDDWVICISTITAVYITHIENNCLSYTQRCNLYLFAAIYTDTLPYVVERVITPFQCSAISPQRSLSPQYDSCSTVDHDDHDDYSADDVDDVVDILSQWSMSPDPPSPKSVATISQCSSHLVPVTSSHRTMSSDLASRKSDDLSTHDLRVLLHHRTTAMQTAATEMIAMEWEVIHRHSGLWAPVYLPMLHHSRRMIQL